MKNKFLILLLVACSSLLLAACGANGNDAAEENEQQPNEQAEVEKVDPDKVVAKVNGKDIKGEEYNLLIQQTQMVMASYGQTGDPDTMKEQALNTLIDQELLAQEVADKGYEATDQEIEDKVTEIKETFENEDQFKEALEANSLTIESLKTQLAIEVALEKYMEKEFPESEVTEEQVKEYYEQARAQNEAQQQAAQEESEEAEEAEKGEEAEEQKFPEFAEVEEQIRNSLEQEEIRNRLQNLVKKKKENSEIETLI